MEELDDSHLLLGQPDTTMSGCVLQQSLRRVEYVWPDSKRSVFAVLEFAQRARNRASSSFMRNGLAM